MRKFACILLALVVPSLLWADDFTGFRVPSHRVYRLQGSVDGSFNRTSNSDNTENNRNWRATGNVSGDGYWLYDSDRYLLKTSLTSGVSGRAEAARSDGISSGDWKDLERSNKHSVAESWMLNSGLRVYPEVIPEFPLGLVGGTQISGGYDQQWDYRRRESASENQFGSNIRDHRYTAYSYSVDGDAGMGVGRVRDVTAVFDWHKMETRLRRDGTLIRPLSHAARQKLIDLVYFGNDYSRIHDRSGKFYWQEVERILLEDSAVGPRGLGAYDVFRMADPYLDNSVSSHYDSSYPGVRERNFTSYGSMGQSYTVLRQRGWFVGFLVFGSHDHRIYRDHSRTRSYRIDNGEVLADTVVYENRRQNYWNDAVYYGPQAEFHMPWGPDWQFDGITTFRIRWEKNDHNQSWTNNAAATYLIADRWLAFGSLGYWWSVNNQWSANSKDDGKAWSVKASGQLNYFIEDRISLYVNLAYSQARNTHELSGDGTYTNLHQWGSSFDARLGITYNFFGRLEAPGIVPASTFSSGRY